MWNDIQWSIMSSDWCQWFWIWFVASMYKLKYLLHVFFIFVFSFSVDTLYKTHLPNGWKLNTSLCFSNRTMVFSEEYHPLSFVINEVIFSPLVHQEFCMTQRPYKISHLQCLVISNIISFRHCHQYQRPCLKFVDWHDSEERQDIPVHSE